MEVAEKKALRMEKLKELYIWNEEHGGFEKNITYRNLRENEQEKQDHLAYEYLADKGLINYKIVAKNMYSAKITSYGIDFVENEM